MLKSNFSKFYRYFGLLVLAAILIPAYQQCGDVGLVSMNMATFQSKGFPLRMNAPTVYPNYRRYVFLVDMSQSMISGPCPFDADVPESVHGFSGVYRQWDPNFENTSDVNDARGLARDCSVKSSLQPGQFEIMRLPASSSYHLVPEHRTWEGSDAQAFRLDILERWIESLQSHPSDEVKRNTNVMIVPLTGGSAYERLKSEFPFGIEFVNVMDPRVKIALQYLRAQHVLNWTNASLPGANPVFTRWTTIDASLNTTMGTTVVGEVLGKIYSPINSDMKSLAEQVKLPGTTYQILHFGDGTVTPLSEHFDRILAMHADCQSCRSDPNKCTGYCSDLYSSMKRSWGDPDANKFEQIKFSYSVLQGLPRFYGSSLFDIQLLALKPQRFSQQYPGQKSLFQKLKDDFDRNKTEARLWEIKSSEPPFKMNSQVEEVTTFKMTHLYLLNPNVRLDNNGNYLIDSDGDGVSDEEELALGLNPLLQRTFGYCLDILNKTEAFRKKCQDLAAAKLCDPTLDSDGDSLNECDEVVYGTDVFDFDTDGDSIPDSLELIYGFNPLISDRDLDSDGDGLPNLVNFAAGLNPFLGVKKLPEEKKISLGVTYLGPEMIQDPAVGPVRVDQYEVKIYNLVSGTLQPVAENSQGDLYITRQSADSKNRELSLILEGHRLLKSSPSNQENRLLGLMRVIDPNNPQKVFWQVLEQPLFLNKINTELVLDLSRFEQIRVLDRNKAD